MEIKSGASRFRTEYQKETCSKLFERKKMILRTLYTIFFISCLVFVSSCVSSRIISKVYEDKHKVYKPGESFYLKTVTVTAFNFFEGEEIGYIINKKMEFAFKNVDGLIFNESAEKNVYIVEPELVIKPFEEKYRMKNYYLLNIRVLHDGRNVLQYAYEYNGTASIFDGRVQNALIGRFIRDIKNYIK